MAVHVSHASLPYPIRNARFSFLVPFLDADGDPTDPTTPDSEISADNATWADAAEEVSVPSGSNGMGLMTLTGAETNNSAIGYVCKVASGPKPPQMALFPRNLAVVGSGTLSAGSAGGGTLGTLLAYDVTGCFIRTTGGTGGGGTGGASNQARRIITYNTGTGAFTVSPNWETTPSTDTTYDVLLPEGVTLGMLRALNPATAGRTAAIDASGRVDLGLWLGTAPLALTSQRVETLVGAMANNVMTAAAAAADLTTELQSGLATASSIADLDTLVDTIITLLGSPAGASVSADLLTLLGRLTSTRAGYLDNLSGGAVALASQVTSIQNNTRGAFIVPEVIERPDSGTADFEIHLYLYDDVGNMEAPDSAPTLALTNQAGTDLSARLDSTTMALVAAGHYVAIYTANVAHALDQLHWEASVVEGTATRLYGRLTQLVDTTAVDFTSADRTQLQAIHGKLPSKDYLAGTANSDGDIQMNESTGDFNATQIARINTEADTALADAGVTTTVTGRIDAAISTRATPTQVNAEVVDALSVDAQAEPTSVPAANASLAAKVSYIFAWRRNRKLQTNSVMTLRNDANDADVATSSVADDGTTLTIGEDT